MMQIYHNPRCGKSRNCLAFVQESKQDFQIIPYLTETPNFDQIKKLLSQLDLEPVNLVRIKEKIWIENFKNKKLTADEVIQAMVDNPILIERPIVVKNGKAIIGRDLEAVASFLE